MAIITPVVAKASLRPKEVQRLYVCPPDKTHAVVTLSFCNTAPELSDTALATIFLSKKTSANRLDESDVLFPNLEIAGSRLFPDLSKIIVGKGESIFVRIEDKTNKKDFVNIRVTGLEEYNTAIINAGKMGSVTSQGPKEGSKILYQPQSSYGAFTIGTVMAGNHTNEEQTCFVTICDVGDQITDRDFTAIMVLEPGGCGFVEDVMVVPGEQISVVGATGKISFAFTGVETSSLDT